MRHRREKQGQANGCCFDFHKARHHWPSTVNLVVFPFTRKEALRSDALALCSVTPLTVSPGRITKVWLSPARVLATTTEGLPSHISTETRRTLGFGAALARRVTGFLTGAGSTTGTTSGSGSG